MGKRVIDDSTLSAIADKIREFLPEEAAESYTPVEMPNGVDAACTFNFNTGYDNGHNDGYKEGFDNGYHQGLDEGNELYDQGVEDGKQAEYDHFWDALQVNGTKKFYQGTFRDAGWTDEVFRPKYDIVPEGSYCIYQTFANSGIVDLKGCLERQGVKMDFSKITNWNGAPFQWSKIETFPVLDCSNCTATNMSYSSFAKHIDMFILKADGSTTTNFAGCTSLEYVRFGGVIGTAINFAESKKLSRASIEDIIAHLSTTTSGLSITLSKTAVNNAFTTDEWTALANTRSNWTINLV